MSLRRGKATTPTERRPRPDLSSPPDSLLSIFSSASETKVPSSKDRNLKAVRTNLATKRKIPVKGIQKHQSDSSVSINSMETSSDEDDVVVPIAPTTKSSKKRPWKRKQLQVFSVGRSSYSSAKHDDSSSESDSESLESSDEESSSSESSSDAPVVKQQLAPGKKRRRVVKPVKKAEESELEDEDEFEDELDSNRKPSAAVEKEEETEEKEDGKGDRHATTRVAKELPAMNIRRRNSKSAKHHAPRENNSAEDLQDTDEEVPLEDTTIGADYSGDVSDMPTEIQFKDDGCGKKRADHFTIQFSIEVTKKEATRLARGRAGHLKQKGRREESKQLLVATDRHCETIIKQVRQRLRTTMLPLVYARTEDSCKEGMDKVNQQREADVKKTAQLHEKLKEQREHFEKQLNEELEKRDQLRQEKLDAEKAGKREIHPAIARYLSESKGSDDLEQPNQRQASVATYRPAPKGTMARLLQKMTSEL
jgi:hypothetical protein